MTVKTLWGNQWLEVRTKDDWYTYTHSPVGDGTGVAILGFRNRNNKIEYLGRFEDCPAHGDGIQLCSLTGMCDVEGEDRVSTALRELKEESGYVVTDSARVLELGSVRPSKASDSEVFLFAVEIEDTDEIVDIEGDGTKGEENAYAKWVSAEELAFSKDPIVSTLILRLIFKRG